MSTFIELKEQAAQDIRAHLRSLSPDSAHHFVMDSTNYLVEHGAVLLAAQLGSIKWGIDSRGRIKIESKDDMRKRGLPSPDRADAMAIAFAGRANAAPMNVESHAGESITGDLMTKAW